MSSTSRTDWSRIDAMTDDDIDTSDIPPLTDEFFSKAKLRIPSSQLATVAVRVDSETLTWFQSKGEDAEQHMAAALRIYAEAQKTAATMRQLSS
ncbi:MAG: BrnA antitoxin family protein [Pseudanabaena sp. SU_2_4]|nr:BrnA antitoxin family protein [Pseudanabaena sp. SU_2_4]NKB18265.1 BrnA antitoxin family protein [Pseudanabaena sp. CRU_2_10]